MHCGNCKQTIKVLVRMGKRNNCSNNFSTMNDETIDIYGELHAIMMGRCSLVISAISFSKCFSLFLIFVNQDMIQCYFLRYVGRHTIVTNHIFGSKPL